MNSQSPLVSVCIPTYNAGPYLKKTLDSIFAQTYQNLEIVVVDNCSTDETVALARNYQGKRENYRIIVNEENIGGENNFNKCLEVATGEFVALYHADDLYHPAIVEECVNFLQQELTVGAVSTLGKIINEKDSPTGFQYEIPSSLKKLRRNYFNFEELFKAILEQGNSFIICPSVMVRKKVIAELGGFEFNLFRSSGDVGLWLKISRRYHFAVIEKSLINYRVHSGQGSQSLIRENPYLADSTKVIRHYIRFSPQLKQKYCLALNQQIIYTLIRRIRLSKFNFNKSLLKILWKNLGQAGFDLISSKGLTEFFFAVILLPLNHWQLSACLNRLLHWRKAVISR